MASSGGVKSDGRVAEWQNKAFARSRVMSLTYTPPLPRGPRKKARIEWELETSFSALTSIKWRSRCRIPRLHDDTLQAIAGLCVSVVCVPAYISLIFTCAFSIHGTCLPETEDIKKSR